MDNRHLMAAIGLGLAALAGGCAGAGSFGEPLAYTPVHEIQPGPGLLTENGTLTVFTTRGTPTGLKEDFFGSDATIFGRRLDGSGGGTVTDAEPASISAAEAAHQAAVAAQQAAEDAERAAEAAERAAAGGR